jgi:hypothetical protein
MKLGRLLLSFACAAGGNGIAMRTAGIDTPSGVAAVVFRSTGAVRSCEEMAPALPVLNSGCVAGGWCSASRVCASLFVRCTAWVAMFSRCPKYYEVRERGVYEPDLSW